MSASPRRRRPSVLLLLGLVVVVPLAAGTFLSGRSTAGQERVLARADRHSASTPLANRAAPRTIPAHVPRLAWQPVLDSTIARANDFTLLGDTLVVLDPVTGQVVLLRERAGSWHQIGSFGKRGGGPGEWQRPVAIAAVGDSVLAVIEMGGRTQRFLANGEYRGAERAALPCPMFAPELAYGDGGVRYLAGNCAFGASQHDTLFTLLFQATGDGDYRELARLPRMGMDLSWGSAFATLHPLAGHGRAVHFALGFDACTYRLPRDGVAGALRPECGLAAERLTAPPPPELLREREEARRRGKLDFARMLRWPDALPVHFGLLPRGDSLFLLRPVSADSAVLVAAGTQRFSADRARLAVPLKHLVACRRNACLWFDENGARLALLR